MKTTCCSMVMLLSCSVFARDYYINPVTGNDSNDGSADSPFQHVSHVHEVNPQSQSCNIILQSGVYEEFIGLRCGENLIGDGLVFSRGITLSFCDVTNSSNTRIENVNLYNRNPGMRFDSFYVYTFNTVEIINCNFLNEISIDLITISMNGRNGNVLVVNCNFDNAGDIRLSNNIGNIIDIDTKFIKCNFTNMEIYNHYPFSYYSISLGSSSRVLFDMCLFENNHVCFNQSSCGLGFCNSNITMLNSIFNNNSVVFGIGSQFLARKNITNSTFYNSQISNYDFPSFHIKDSIIFQSGNESDYISNVNCYYGDPLVNSDFTLSENSPCRDAGSWNSFGINETDFYGNPRVMGGRIDIGACEFLDRPFVFGDMNCDGRRDNFDIDMFVDSLLYQTNDCNILNGDMNRDGLLNNFDIDLFADAILQ